jgi:energy-coupling factor transporter ATP-binding protein EcfA2
VIDQPAIPKAVAERSELLRREFENAIARSGNKQLIEMWREWEARFKRISADAHLRPEVVTAFVGGTGAGKSTLLNALLGVRLLPVNQMLACTAAISEVSYAEGPSYSAEIEFVTREEWDRERELLLGDIAESRTCGDPLDDSQADIETPGRIAREAREKLWAVYRPTEDSDPYEVDMRTVKEPAEITNALKRGKEHTETQDIKEFRRWIAEYLDSKHRYWPIVKVVRVRGPFSALASGAKLVDLPGLNDPNEARERITKNYLKTCRFVWLIFNIKRLLTRDIWNIMLSEDFLRQVVMDGRVGSLTFVGTASDDIELDSGIEQFGLSEDAVEADVVLARNREVRKAVSRQLKEVSSDLVDRAGEEQAKTGQLTTAFQRAGVFTVSAKEYLRLSGLSKTHAVILNHVDETEVPALRKHLDGICAAYGVEAHCKSLQKQMGMIEDEIRRAVIAQRVRVERRAETTLGQRQEVEKAAEAARMFLRNNLTDFHERFVQNLEADQEIFRERLKASIQRGRMETDNVLARWSRMHWATMRAVVRWGGRFVGSTGTHDFPADLAKPILDPIVLAWADFFGDRLSLGLDKWTERLLASAERFFSDLARITRDDSTDPRVAQDTKKVAEVTDRLLRELLGQAKAGAKEKIDEVRRTLYEQIPTQIRNSLKPGFEKAAQESGPGMKRRMVDILSAEVSYVSQIMFADAEQAVLTGVRALIEVLSRNYKGMTEAVDRQASIVLNDTVGSAKTESVDTVSSALHQLSEILEVLDGLPGEAA